VILKSVPEIQFADLRVARFRGRSEALKPLMRSGCTGSPASTFKVTAVPAEPAIGARSFCSDQSAVIRYAMDGKAATCLTSGKPLN
jgi:hypothetical protein